MQGISSLEHTIKQEKERLTDLLNDHYLDKESIHVCDLRDVGKYLHEIATSITWFKENQRIEKMWAIQPKMAEYRGIR